MTENPPLEFLRCIALFLVVVLGLGLPPVASLKIPAAEKLCAAAVVGLAVLYLYGLISYWAGVPPIVHKALPWVALSLVAARWEACLAVFRDPTARSLLFSQALVTVWMLGFLALVRSYSGASWALDWAGHYDRAQLFLQQRPTDHLAFAGEAFASRPPLVNIVTADLLALTGDSFADFQVLTTLLATLAFLPGWLWAARLGGGAQPAAAIFTVLYLANPSILQNSTFAWTKLPTAFAVLSALYFFDPGHRPWSTRRLATAFVLLAAAVLAHYSAAPYAIAFVIAVTVAGRASPSGLSLPRAGLAALPALALLATWLGWSLAANGFAGTFLSNTSVTSAASDSFVGLIREKGLNLFYTIVPHPLRAPDYSFIFQASRVGHVRDYFFLLYQVNLLLLFGSIGSVVLLGRLGKHWAAAPTVARRFWILFLGGSAFLGIAASGGVDPWGVAHLCLQGLLVLGLAFLAAEAPRLTRGWQIFYALGLAADFVLGVGLHFLVENTYHSPLEALRDGGASVAREFGNGAWINFQYKLQHGFEFVGDWPVSRPILLMLLAAILGLALLRVRPAKIAP